jgi:hypothetical protein
VDQVRRKRCDIDPDYRESDAELIFVDRTELNCCRALDDECAGAIEGDYPESTKMKRGSGQRRAPSFDAALIPKLNIGTDPNGSDAMDGSGRIYPASSDASHARSLLGPKSRRHRR